MSKVSVRQIQRATCRHFGIQMVDMLAQSKFQVHAEPRQIAMYLSRKIALRPWLFIAREFKRDHSTIIHAFRKIETRADAGCERTLEHLAAIKTALDEDAERRRVAAMREAQG